MLIIHGDNLVQSRLKLTEIIRQKRAAGCQVTRLEAASLTRASLESQFLAKSLFNDDKLTVIEGIFSLPKSKKKDELIELIKNTSQDQGLSAQIITWDSKSVPATTLKKMTGSQVLEFKTSSVVFKWLDALNGQKKRIPEQISLLHQATQSDGVELCLALLARQIRLLIQAIEKAPIAAPPFVIKKLNQQASTFTITQLLKIHHQLVQIDREIKTSQLNLSLEKKLDLLMMNM